MQLPKGIVSANKIRDYHICRLYLDGLLPEEIKSERNLQISIRRIQQILYENSNFIEKHAGWDKSKRIIWLQRQLKDKPTSRKDAADLLEQMRKEKEGDKPLVDNSKHQTNITWVIDGKRVSPPLQSGRSLAGSEQV